MPIKLPVQTAIDFSGVVEFLEADEPATVAARRPTQLIDAASDIDAVRSWLDYHADSPHTLRAYRKEVVRLVLWCSYVRRASLRTLKREDVAALLEFLANPPPEWIGSGRAKRTSPDWRPFQGPLKPEALHQARIILHSLFDWLVNAHYLDGNPFSLVKPKKSMVAANGLLDTATRRARRHQLSTEALRFALMFVRALPEQTPMERCKKARDEFALLAFLYTGARLFELARATSGNLYKENDRWWLMVLGKGKKIAPLPVVDELMACFTRYRSEMGLTAYPAVNENKPLISRLKDPERPITENMLYRVVTAIFRGAEILARDQGDQASATLLHHATTHWLRHTTIGITVNETGDIGIAQQLARHGSHDTTAKYATVADKTLHDTISTALARRLSIAGEPSA